MYLTFAYSNKLRGDRMEVAHPILFTIYFPCWFLPPIFTYNDQPRPPKNHCPPEIPAHPTNKYKSGAERNTEIPAYKYWQGWCWISKTRCFHASICYSEYSHEIINQGWIFFHFGPWQFNSSESCHQLLNFNTELRLRTQLLEIDVSYFDWDMQCRTLLFFVI